MEQMETFIYYSEHTQEALEHFKKFEALMIASEYKMHTIAIGTCTGSSILAVICLHYKEDGKRAINIQIAVDYNKLHFCTDKAVHQFVSKYIPRYPYTIQKLLGDFDHVKF
jgi:hypothetical protein